MEYKRKEKKNRKERTKNKKRKRNGARHDRKITLVPGRNIPGTNIHICTGWITRYKWGLAPSTNACFSSSVRNLILVD
jgi:hypothetical protein